MKPLVLAGHVLVASGVFFGLVAVAAAVARRSEHSDEFSWTRYVGFLLLALALEAGIALSPSPWIATGALVALTLTVLLRAAFDAQSTGLREKAGFLQLYGALLLAQILLLRRSGALEGAVASPWLSFQIHDHLGHLLLPLPSLLPLGAVPVLADPGAVTATLGTALAAHTALVVALSTFALSAFAYSHFAEHATRNVGLSLLPAPMMATVAFIAVWVASRLLPLPARDPLAYAHLFLTPYFVAEGLWVVHRMARRLRTRGAWTALLASGALLIPALAYALVVLGIVFHLVQLRAFQPVLGDLERTASRPRLGAAIGATLAASLVFVALALFDRAALAGLSPALETPPAACGQTTLLPDEDGVRVRSPAASFVIDADETPLVASGSAEAARACASRGARLCTSDEWALACVCTYPNESDGGPKMTTNARLSYRVESEREALRLSQAEGAERAPSRDRHVHALLTGRSEIVSGGERGIVLVAGPGDAVPDPWAEDCRYRALLTAPGLKSAAFLPVAARCCR